MFDFLYNQDFIKLFLLIVMTASFSLKSYVLFTLLIQKTNSKNTNFARLLLITVLIGALAADVAWVFTLAQNLFFPNSDYRIKAAILRIAWSLVIVEYLALALFIDNLIEKKQKIKWYQIGMSAISFMFVVVQLLIAIFDFNCMHPQDRSLYELYIRDAGVSFSFFFVLLPTLVIVLYKFRKMDLPRILKKQFTLLIKILIIPYWICDILQLYPLAFSPTWRTNSYAAVIVSTSILTYAVYYCMRKMMGLRFLNIRNHVQTPHRFNFVDTFKGVLEQLSHASTVKELAHISQQFFKETLQIPLGRTHFHICHEHLQLTHSSNREPELNPLEQTIEAFLHREDEIGIHVKQAKVLIHDEIAFNDFYDGNENSHTIVQFLETVQADIILPLYRKKELVGYIMIERFARGDRFYSSVERDEMLVFSNYLVNIIHLLQTRNLSTLIHKEKSLQEELYSKHQEINQYKESMRSFLKSQRHKEIGIIFYKNRRFTFGNEAAKELIFVNLNTQLGHPITKACKDIARHVTEYKSPKNCIIKDQNGNKLVLSGVPNIEQSNVIITVSRPDISDIIKQQASLLKDPTAWDYLLYLETTKSGQLINQAIPGTGETLLDFKINLLKTALSKKAILLEMPEDDLLPTVELLHHISLREQLHVLKLTSQPTNYNIAIKLFGINPLFGKQLDGKPLLEKLDTVGTLFIQNIELLDLETQNYLAEYIKYGYYRIFKSDQKIPSNVRIVCSSHKNIHAMVQDGTFSEELYEELHPTTISLPSLLTLPEDELRELTDGFTEQALQVHDFKHLLELSPREKVKLAIHRPVSLHEFKHKVQQLLIKKSKQNEFYTDTQFDPAYQVTNPELIQAARLGKHALRDQRTMTLLWNTFKNQNKIATFLGVNRSSVNRRCKEYNLL